MFPKVRCCRLSPVILAIFAILGAHCLNGADTLGGNKTTTRSRGIFVAVGDRGAAYSADGVTWQASDTMPLDHGAWVSVAYGDGTFVAVCSYGGAYSTDGIHWREGRGIISKANWNSPESVAYAAGRFVAVCGDGEKGTIARSSNGRDWDSCDLPAGGDWLSTVSGNGTFLAIESLHTRTLHSSDGTRWQCTAGPLLPDDCPCTGQTVAFGGGRFVTVGGDQSAFSVDGLAWTASVPRALPQVAWTSLTYGQGMFLAVASGLSARSADGVAWAVSNDLPAKSGLNIRAAYGNGIFVILSPDGAWHSADGISWQPSQMPFGANWESISFGAVR